MMQGISSGQDILYDDIIDSHSREEWSNLIDTLTAYGANFHFVAEEGWTNLMNMNALWIESPSDTYSTSLKHLIQNYVRSGGKIILGDALAGNSADLNNLLADTGWQTTMEIDTDYHPIDIIETIFYFFKIYPFTNGITHLVLREPKMILCGENSFPFAFRDSSYNSPVAAISYPFLHEGNCSSFIVLITGTHIWENDEITRPDDYRFATNIILCAADIPGFEIEPCAIPEYPNGYWNCERKPNPFTPNSDGENDYTYFTFDGIGEKEATIYIYDNRSILVRKIYVPAGAEAKSAARWDGRDENRRSLPQGLYLYVIESDGEVLCNGTITLAR